MIVPEFIRFYGYTAGQALQEYAVTFFSLVNSMYRLKANEALTSITVSNATEDMVGAFIKQSKGIHGIVQEARVAKAIKK